MLLRCPTWDSTCDRHGPWTQWWNWKCAVTKGCLCSDKTIYQRMKMLRSKDLQSTDYRVGQKSKPLRLKAHIFCLYLQNAWTNFHGFWQTSTSSYSEHIHLFRVPQISSHGHIICSSLRYGTVQRPAQTLRLRRHVALRSALWMSRRK